MTTPLTWFQIDIELSDIESNGWKLFELGAAGVEELAPNRARVFFQGDNACFSSFQSFVVEEGITIIEARSVPDINWVAKCEELLVPVEIERIVIEPGSAENKEPKDDKISIFLPPGIGFGTGHHPSTHSMLSMLQSPHVAGLPPRRILDLGTGSGILAIAAALIFPFAKIEAIDTDGEAIRAALENARKNGVGDKISFKYGEISGNEEPYDLVLANIYAEILVDLEPLLRKSVRSKGMLLLAGILHTSADLVRDAYNGKHWDTEIRRETGEWFAYTLRRS